MTTEGLRPGARQLDLPDRRRRLAFLELEKSFGQLQHRSAERDGARGHHEKIASLAVQGSDIRNERSEPGLLHPPGLGIDQERRADLDDDTAEVVNGWKHAG